jgi:hypothetical protein
MGSGREVHMYKNTSLILFQTSTLFTHIPFPPLSYSQKCRSEAKLNNVDKQTKGQMGFEPPSRTIHSITRQRQYDHDYCAPAFSQVNLLLIVVMG